MDRKDSKFGLHLLISAIIVMIMGTTEVFFVGSSISYFIISTWAIGVSIPFWLNQNDIRINSFLASLLFPIIFIDLTDWIAGAIFNLIHVIPFISIIYIFVKSKPISVRYGLYSGDLNLAFSTIFRYMGLAYWYYNDAQWLFLFPMLYLYSLFIIYLVTRKRKTKIFVGEIR